MRHAAVDELVEPTRERGATGRNDGDVAKLAGVSQQTVSRVVNARDFVGWAPRERLLSAVRELDYCPTPLEGRRPAPVRSGSAKRPP
jgi:hypothetical protein